MQSRIEIPDGYRGVIHPSPRAQRAFGILTRTEELFGDGRVAAGSNTVVFEATNRMSHIWSRSKDYMRIEQGQILGVLRIVRKT